MTDVTRACTWIATTLVALGLLAGCSQLEPAAPAQPLTDPTQLYLGLRLNHPAVNLTTDTTVATYSRLQLVAIPYDGTGTAIPNAPTATFTSTDTLALTVTADGLLQAHRAANGVKVIVTLVLGEVRRTDTAVVNILNLSSPPVLDTFSIHVSPDSSVWYVPPRQLPNTPFVYTEVIASAAGLDPTPVLSVREVDAAGNLISGLVVDYASLDSSVVVVDRHTGRVTTIPGAGHARIVVQTSAFGVSKADTMVYTVQPPLVTDVYIDSLGFYATDPQKDRPVTAAIEIAAGGIIGWVSQSMSLVDVTFDNPAQVTEPTAAFCATVVGFLGAAQPYCDAGDIPAFGPGDGTAPLRWRQFLIPGTYPYHSTITGKSGKVVVLDRVPLP